MRQFDVVENLNELTHERYPFVVIRQHDRLSATPALDRLHPAISLNGERYRVIIEELAGVHRQTLGATVGSLEAERYAIIAALDLLFTGI